MPSLDDIVAAAAGDERDALRRAMAEDVETAALRDGPGFVRASTPADLARALGRDRRARLSTGSYRVGVRARPGA